MVAERKKSLTQRLIQTSRACRGRSGAYLARFDLHAGQETVLQALAVDDGMSMSALAVELGVQPPTVTKMIARLAAQGYLSRRSSNGDARQAHVFLTGQGRSVAALLDELIDHVEEEALAGLDEKERKRLRKMLKQIESNLAKLGEPELKPRRAVAGKPRAAKKESRARKGGGKSASKSASKSAKSAAKPSADARPLRKASPAEAL